MLPAVSVMKSISACAPSAKAAFDSVKAPVVAYVSCDVATLARDARKFVDAGYTLERLVGFDLFPNTAHIETVIAFAR